MKKKKMGKRKKKQQPKRYPKTPIETNYLSLFHFDVVNKEDIHQVAEKIFGKTGYIDFTTKK